MKKVFLGLSAFGILGFFSGAFADNGDIISAFTNNRFNEKSANVKELNDEQMSQVVGGLVYYGTNRNNTSFWGISLNDVMSGLNASETRKANQEINWIASRLDYNEILGIAIDRYNRRYLIAIQNNGNIRDMSLFSANTPIIYSQALKALNR